MKDKKEEIFDTLYKKAMGYVVEEIVEEYSGDEQGGELLKRKVTTKPIPPDMTALKTYIEYQKSYNEYENMNDEELEKERKRLLSQLKVTEELNENRTVGS